jgi:hypothetical protein
LRQKVTDRYSRLHTEHPDQSHVGRTLEETAILFDGETPVEEMVHQGGEAATMTITRGPGELFDEIESRLNASEVLEKHPRRATGEFYGLKQTKSSSTDSTIDRTSSGAQMSGQNV